jgi:hypothetical protein
MLRKLPSLLTLEDCCKYQQYVELMTSVFSPRDPIDTIISNMKGYDITYQDYHIIRELRVARLPPDETRQVFAYIIKNYELDERALSFLTMPGIFSNMFIEMYNKHLNQQININMKDLVCNDLVPLVVKYSLVF